MLCINRGEADTKKEGTKDKNKNLFFFHKVRKELANPKLFRTKKVKAIHMSDATIFKRF